MHHQAPSDASSLPNTVLVEQGLLSSGESGDHTPHSRSVTASSYCTALHCTVLTGSESQASKGTPYPAVHKTMLAQPSCNYHSYTS